MTRLDDKSSANLRAPQSATRCHIVISDLRRDTAGLCAWGLVILCGAKDK